jgi:hypothetical protein
MKIPCKDCLCLAMCINKFKLVYNMYFVTIDARQDCSLISKYLDQVDIKIKSSRFVLLRKFILKTKRTK